MKAEQREIAVKVVDVCLGKGERLISLNYATKQIPLFHTKAAVCVLTQFSGNSCPATILQYFTQINVSIDMNQTKRKQALGLDDVGIEEGD